MAKKKVYAVKAGFKTGLFDTWDECQKQVKGFPGALFKGFATKEEALQYLDETPIKEVKTVDELKQAVEKDYKGTRVFVDGSWNNKTKTYGAGICFIDSNGQIFHEFATGGNDPELAKSRNIAGECLAATFAIEMAEKMGLNEITIIHDYEGIAKWVVDSPDKWKVSSVVSALYTETYEQVIEKGMKIHFIWVRGHVGVEGNEIVDKLAKQGCGLL